MQKIKLKNSLFSRIFLMLVIFFVSIVLQVAIWNYQTTRVIQPLSNRTLVIQNISQALDLTESTIKTYENFRWEIYNTADFISEIRQGQEKMRDSLSLFSFSLSSEDKEEYLLSNAILTSFQSLTSYNDELFSLLLANQMDKASALYFESINSCINYMKQYTQQLLETAIAHNHDEYEMLLKLNTQLKQLQSYIISFSLIMGVIVLFSLISLLGFVKTLSQQSKAIGDGNFDLPDIAVQNTTELSDMANAFNTMKKSMKLQVQLLEEKNEVERELFQKQNETLGLQNLLEREKLQQLRSQINPHFLFNTLNVIKISASDENAKKTEEMVGSLGKLYRYAMGSNQESVPLSREIQIVKALFSLYKARFGDKIDMLITIAPDVDVTQVYVPSFILQPIVENSFKHGLSPKEERGLVNIQLYEQNELLHISIKDDGIGMDEETLFKLRKRMEEVDSFGEHIGLYNVAARLKILDKRSGLAIDSTPGVGTTIHLWLPLVIINDEEEL